MGVRALEPATRHGTPGRVPLPRRSEPYPKAPATPPRLHTCAGGRVARRRPTLAGRPRGVAGASTRRGHTRARARLVARRRRDIDGHLPFHGRDARRTRPLATPASRWRCRPMTEPEEQLRAYATATTRAQQPVAFGEVVARRHRGGRAFAVAAALVAVIMIAGTVAIVVHRRHGPTALVVSPSASTSSPATTPVPADCPAASLDVTSTRGETLHPGWLPPGYALIQGNESQLGAIGDVEYDARNRRSTSRGAAQIPHDAAAHATLQGHSAADRRTGTSRDRERRGADTGVQRDPLETAARRRAHRQRLQAFGSRPAQGRRERPLRARLTIQLPGPRRRVRSRASRRSPRSAIPTARSRRYSPRSVRSVQLPPVHN